MTSRPVDLKLEGHVGRAAFGRGVGCSDAAEDFASEGCDRCGGPHPSSRCPFFPAPRSSHADAWVSVGKARQIPSDKHLGFRGDISILTSDSRVLEQPGDGNCLFHSLAFHLGISHAEVREKIYCFVQSNKNLPLNGYTVDEWITAHIGDRSSTDRFISRMKAVA